MKQKSITMPDVKKWTVAGINKLVKKYKTFGKDASMKYHESVAIVCTSMFAELENANLNAKEIRDLVSAFNKSNSKKDAIKRYMVMQALFFAKTITNLTVNTHSYEVYKSPKIELPPTYKYFEKNKGIGKAHIYDLFEKGYIGVPRVVGKISTGFCNHEVDEIKTQKILNLDNISKLSLKKDASGYRLVVTLE